MIPGFKKPKLPKMPKAPKPPKAPKLPNAPKPPTSSPLTSAKNGMLVGGRDRFPDIVDVCKTPSPTGIPGVPQYSPIPYPETGGLLRAVPSLKEAIDALSISTGPEGREELKSKADGARADLKRALAIVERVLADQTTATRKLTE